jgi:xanthine dehydrogenase accessory factor
MTRPPHELILETALDWHRAGVGAALATVVETWGSAPRPVGSQLAISGTGAIAGSVSGGCVEGAVVAEAVAALADGRPRVLGFDVSDDTAFANGLACGGRIRVLVEPVGEGGVALSAALLDRLAAARVDGRPVALVTNLADWGRALVLSGVDPEVDARLRADRSGLTPDDRFIAVHAAPLRLIVVGATHIAQPLIAIARTCGFAPVLIDPRSAFATAERFPDMPVLDDWPDEAIGKLAPDARSAIVTLTHDSKLDDPALIAALRSDAFYIGCLGSRRTHAARVERLAEAGLPPDRIARLQGPVGLAIGATSPAEIAVSIMAQIIQRLRAADQT